MSLHEILKSKFGFAEFRGVQEEAITAVLKGENALIIMPTGMGKSLCYQLPSYALSGLTVVLSPLIALMKDQVDAAKKKGLACDYINSSLNQKERQIRYDRLKNGDYKLIYVTPERFRKAEFLEALRANEVSLLAVDEAHCISQWGHDFRPDYSRVGEIRQQLSNPPTLALTATATKDVQSEIVEILEFDSSRSKILIDGIKRENLELNFFNVVGETEKVQHIVGLRHQSPGAGIIYFSLISSLESVSRELQKVNIPHLKYHGQLDPKQRKRMQEKFLNEDDHLILATPAFGLGIDKPNIRSVIHAEVPGSIEAYYQEVGRAGRDGLAANCALLYDEDDVSIQMDFIKWANPEPSFTYSLLRLVEKNIDRVRMEGADYLRSQMNFYNSRDFRLETSLNLLAHWGVILFPNKDFKKIEVIDEMDSIWLDEKRYEKRIKSLQSKLLEMIQLIKTTEEKKPYLYKYFGVDD